MIKKIICIGVMLVMAGFLGMSFAGCEPKSEWALESGFESESYGGTGWEPPASPYRCAYRSNKTEFDISDVTLMFFYGNIKVLAGEPYPDKDGLIERISHIEVYFSSCAIESYIVTKIPIKTIPANEFFTDEYVRTKDERYNHSEVLTVPRELFESAEKGIIGFGINEIYTEEYKLLSNNELGLGAFTSVNYKVVENKIKLSVKPFK